DRNVTGVQTCALPISIGRAPEVVSIDLAVRAARPCLDEQVILEILKHERLQPDGQRPDLVSVAREVERGAPFEVARPDGRARERSEERRVGKEWRSRG